MAHFRIVFQADPEHGTAPWSGRESARIKMMQSLSDYLTNRCGAWDVRVVEVIEQHSDAVLETAKKRSRSSKT